MRLLILRSQATDPLMATALSLHRAPGAGLHALSSTAGGPPAIQDPPGPQRHSNPSLLLLKPALTSLLCPSCPGVQATPSDTSWDPVRHGWLVVSLWQIHVLTSGGHLGAGGWVSSADRPELLAKVQPPNKTGT